MTYSILKSFLDNNAIDISQETLNHVIYQCIIDSIAADACKRLNDSEYKQKFKQEIRKDHRMDRLSPYRRLFNNYNLTNEELQYLSTIVKSFIYKSDSRSYDIKVLKKPLYEKQCGKCNCCGKEINIDDCEVDHIIPFSLVGDELSISNYQLLCRECNLMKTNDPWFPIHYLIRYKQLPHYIINQ